MFKITEISPQQKGSLLNVFVNGEYAFSADSGFIVDEDIFVGRLLDDGAFTALKTAAGVRKAMRHALFLLEHRDFSKKELASRLEEKGYDPLVYRFFCLQSHYRKSLVFSYENLDNAATSFNKLLARVVALHKDEQGEIDTNAFAELKAKFMEALDNDMNTSLAVTALYDVLKANTTAATKIALIDDFDKVLSLDLNAKAKKLIEAENAAAEEKSRDPFVQEIEALLAERQQAKKDKNYKRADEIRDSLKARGIIIEDTPTGAKWKQI